MQAAALSTVSLPGAVPVAVPLSPPTDPHPVIERLPCANRLSCLPVNPSCTCGKCLSAARVYHTRNACTSVALSDSSLSRLREGNPRPFL